MELSNRILASFLVAFIISIAFGTTWVLNEIDILTGNVGNTQRAQVSITIASICGDALVTGNEVCDGTNLSGETCVTLGNTGGTLACLSACTGFNTQQCLNATVNVTTAVAVVRPSTGGVATSMTYVSSIANTFDFAITRTQTVNVEFKGKTYAFTLEEFTDNYAIIKITASPARYLKIFLGQTIVLDLDEDGVLDFYITLADILTRRAVFHIEKIEQVSKESSPKIGIQVPKFETPKLSDYTDYYKASFLLLMVLVLAIINFAIFKKFIVSKK